MENLYQEIKQLIIESLNLEGVTADDIDTNAALFGDGLGLDSIDALELGIALKNRFGIVLSSENQDVKEHFASVASLAAFIQSQQEKAAS